MTKNFYKYISKRGSSYAIVKRGENGVEWYGTYCKLSDALYERDRLIQVDWDWDALMSLEETENHYEKMTLPKFIHDTMYIQFSPQKYKVYIKKEYKGTFKNKGDAEAYAEEIGGRIVTINTKYKVQKSINGEVKYFGQYPTLKKAQEVRDKLIKNGWNYESIKRGN